MSSQIHFFYEDIRFHLNSIRSTKSWIRDVVKKEAKSLAELSFIFCSDVFLHRINVDFLNHDTLTDIITFDTSEVRDSIEGEIYISIERVKENAAKYDIHFGDELHRVMVHGVLHLAGYSDKTSQQKRMMRKKEDAYLSLRTF